VKTPEKTPEKEQLFQPERILRASPLRHRVMKELVLWAKHNPVSKKVSESEEHVLLESWIGHTDLLVAQALPLINMRLGPLNARQRTDILQEVLRMRAAAAVVALDLTILDHGLDEETARRMVAEAEAEEAPPAEDERTLELVRPTFDANGAVVDPPLDGEEGGT